MITTAIGVGVLLLPYLYIAIGWVQGVLYMVIAVFIMGFMCVVYVWSLEVRLLQTFKRVTSKHFSLAAFLQLGRHCRMQDIT